MHESLTSVIINGKFFNKERGNIMKVLITGSEGFVGKNLVAELKAKDVEVLTFDKINSLEDLNQLVNGVDFIVHLAGSNRPTNPEEFYNVNQDLTQNLIEAVKENKSKAPILLSSSIQATLDNDYGKSKLAGEQVLLDYSSETGNKVMIYRYSNLFGKWSKPNYNTVIATWCHNISRDLPITINDPKVELNLMYIDDVIEEIVNAIDGLGTKVQESYYTVPISYTVSLKTIFDLLNSFKDSRKNLFVPNMSPGFETKLYSTYLSFLPEDKFSYPLTMHEDDRGSFTEFLKSNDRGQVSINISKPGITKGEHWHHSKNEKFLVVKGEGLIQLRDIFSEKVIEYSVSCNKLEVVDIPTGYTHNIINNSDEDMVTVMWVNEPFDPSKPDTYFEKVNKD